MAPWRRRERGSALTIFYAADIHGSEKCFKKFLNAGKFYGADVLILGGDLTGKAMVPILSVGGNSYEANYLGRKVVVDDEPGLTQLESSIRFNGFYPYRCDPDELRELQTNPLALQTRIDATIRQDLTRWMRLAEERLGESKIECIIMPGNDDPEFTNAILEEAPSVQSAEGRILQVRGFQVLSLGYSNVTPWHTPRELEEDEIDRRLRSLAADLDPSLPVIFNLHVPPEGSGLDLAPQLRPDFTVVGGNHPRMIPVGSSAVARAIETTQPLLGLHGHIHESRGMAMIGRSVCLNPGSEYNAGVLRGVIVRVGSDSVISHQFVAA